MGEKDDKDINIDLSLGGLLDGLGEFVEMLGEMEKKGESEKEFSGEKDIAGGKGKAMYGFSVRLGEVGERLGEIEERIEEFGNIKQTEDGPVVDDVREPMVDIFEEEDKLTIVAEIPGVSKDDMEFTVEERTLIIQARSEVRKYKKEIDLPDEVPEGESPNARYKNGILTIIFSKED